MYECMAVYACQYTFITIWCGKLKQNSNACGYLYMYVWPYEILTHIHTFFFTYINMYVVH